MEYREIVSVTGIGGLFQLMATKNDGAIVRNLGDKSTKFIPARLHNVTPLESIEVYTTGENVRLHQVFQLMKDNPTVEMPDAKNADNNTIKGYFKSIFPEFDDERVYVSDMKKMLKWFTLLKENDLLNFESLEAALEEAIEEVIVEEQPEEKPKKAAKKKAETTDEATEEKPKKTVKKKKVEEGTEDAAEKPTKKTAKKKKED